MFLGPPRGFSPPGIFPPGAQTPREYLGGKFFVTPLRNPLRGTHPPFPKGPLPPSWTFPGPGGKRAQMPGEPRRNREKSARPSEAATSASSTFADSPKDRFYLYQARWRPDLPMAHILPHWNWPERIGKVTPVHVYTSGDEPELFLNGKSLGRKKKAALNTASAGTMSATNPEPSMSSPINGKKWAEDTVQTTGKPAALALSADRGVLQADGSDLCFVTLRITDDRGRTVPRTNLPVEFFVEGPAEIAATGNGNPANRESFKSPRRHTFNGLALLIVRTKENVPGNIRIKAVSPGLAPAEIRVKSR